MSSQARPTGEWGLRDYGTGAWEGGDPDCDHSTPRSRGEDIRPGDKQGTSAGSRPNTLTTCKCGATRVDQQIGLEPTPEQFVSTLVDVFREVRRVLRDDGTLWLNLGDSYTSSGSAGDGTIGATSGLSGAGSDRYRATLAAGHATNRPKQVVGLKPKDLVGIPWRVAFALQQPYYTGRIAAERDRVWLAAILDGEGTICGMRHTRPDGNVRTGCMVFITNTSEALLDECDRIWKGARYSEKTTSEVARPCWRWELQQAEDRSALVRELYPYLIEKKQQALVAWNLLEFVQAAKRMGRGGELDATKEKRDYLVRLLGDLNARRPVDLPSWLGPVPDLYEPGWYLRSDVIWAKSNPMPESVTDRPTKAHEYVFLLSKSPRYFFDQEAVREGVSPNTHSRGSGIGPKNAGTEFGQGIKHNEDYARAINGHVTSRNVRSVWEIATQPYPEAHFATFPEALPDRCIRAGTSERGCCPECGAPWVRQTETVRAPDHRERGQSYITKLTGERGARLNEPAGVNAYHQKYVNDVTTIGWRPSCDHDQQPVPCTVLDPFMGSATTALVARRLGRRSIGIELNEEYAKLAARRLQQQSLFAGDAA